METIPHEDLQQFKRELISELKRELRVELMALHLGDDYLVDEEAAARLTGISKRQMRRLRAAGEIHGGKIGHSPRYSLGQIRRFMRETVTP